MWNVAAFWQTDVYQNGEKAAFAKADEVFKFVVRNVISTGLQYDYYNKPK